MQDSGRSESALSATLCALLIFPAVVFLSQVMGLNLLSLQVLPLFVPLVVMCAAYDLWRQRWRVALDRRDVGYSLAVLCGGVSIFLWIFAPTDIIPAHDSIAVPAFARIFYETGEIPTFVGAEQRVPFLYPPGFPILIADLFTFLSPSFVLIVFKYLCVVAVGATPFCWALMCWRLFRGPGLSLWALVLASYVGFIVFDRTLVFGLAVAGKNSQLFQSALLPLFFISLVSVRRVWQMVVLAIAGCGMFLIHYSGMYMLAILLGVWSIVDVAKRRSLRGCWRAWCIFTLSVGLFLPRAMHVSRNSGAVSVATGGGGVDWTILEIFRAEFNNFIFIFNEIGIPWSYKGTCAAVLIVCALLASLVCRMRRHSVAETLVGNSIFTAFAVLLGCWLCAALIGYGVLPVPGINLDYTRWFSYNFLSITIGLNLVLIAPYLFHSFLVVPSIVLFAYGFWNSSCDIQAARSWIQSKAFPLSDIRLLMEVLPKNEPCQVMTKNGGLGHFMYQLPRVLEYIPVVSNCDVVSGSYIAPDSYGLDAHGVPTPEFIRERSARGPIYFLGKVGEAKRLKVHYAVHGFALVPVRKLDRLGLWRLDEPAS